MTRLIGSVHLSAGASILVSAVEHKHGGPERRCKRPNVGAVFSREPLWSSGFSLSRDWEKILTLRPNSMAHP